MTEVEGGRTFSEICKWYQALSASCPDFGKHWDLSLLTRGMLNSRELQSGFPAIPSLSQCQVLI